MNTEKENKEQGINETKDSVMVIHGESCRKQVHFGDGLLHSEVDDTSYLVDGQKYCGRCHTCL